MSIKISFIKVLFSTLFVFSYALDSFSQQTVNDAIMAYNKGLNSRQGENYDSAIVYFNEATSIAKQLGEEGEEVVINVESQLPALYYQKATQLYNDKKVDEAIQYYNTTVELANKANDSDLAQKATGAMSEMYYFKGATSFQNKDYEGAKTNFNKAIEILPENTKAYYMLTATYKSTNDDENFYNTAKKSAEVAKANNDSKYYENTIKLAGDYFLKKGNDAKKAEKYSDAEKNLKNSLEFDSDDPKAYYLLTQVYNAQKKWDSAIEAANKTLEYEKDTPEDKAKAYYELGNAYKNKGDKTNACSAYKKSAVGPFKESAEYIVKNDLKCE